jgi:ABC-type transporter Mla MlaB component
MKQNKRKRENAVTVDATDVAVEPAAEQQTAVEQQTVVERQTAANQYALQSSCTVRDSVALRQALLGLIDEPAPVTLDVRAVERVDTAAMQVLCAFVRDRSAAGRAVSWLGAPEPLIEAIGLLGMSQTLGLPAAASGVSA